MSPRLDDATSRRLALLQRILLTIFMFHVVQDATAAGYDRVTQTGVIKTRPPENQGTKRGPRGHRGQSDRGRRKRGWLRAQGERRRRRN